MTVNATGVVISIVTVVVITIVTFGNDCHCNFDRYRNNYFDFIVYF